MEGVLLIMFLLGLLIWIVMLIHSFKELDKKMYIVSIIFTIIFSVSIGMMIPQNVRHAKKMVTPKVNVTCIDNKCDTTYIYNFKKN
jgi:Mn2+/Fe2+ NRAMP family transporter